jgi:hypothetical protein
VFGVKATKILKVFIYGYGKFEVKASRFSAGRMSREDRIVDIGGSTISTGVIGVYYLSPPILFITQHTIPTLFI